jgi:hypothetical protein
LFIGLCFLVVQCSLWSFTKALLIPGRQFKRNQTYAKSYQFSSKSTLSWLFDYLAACHQSDSLMYAVSLPHVVSGFLSDLSPETAVLGVPSDALNAVECDDFAALVFSL